MNRIHLKFKEDHYETEVFLESVNCQAVLQADSEIVYLKVDNKCIKRLNEIKREINLNLNRNPELYCDCKKIIKVGNTFEEVIKTKTNGFEFQSGELYTIKFVIYGVWINKSSYGPMIKIIESSANKMLTFLKDDLTDSDEEINNNFEFYNKINLKNKV
jgi:hypothetical protein